MATSKEYTLDEIREKARPIAEKHGLKAIYLFGSYSRGEATADSDIDVLIDRDGSKIHSLLQIEDFRADMEDAFGKEVDVLTVQGLSQGGFRHESDLRLQKNVKREAVRIYGEQG